MSNSGSLLRVNDVDAAYQTLQVLWDISLTLNRGEIIGLIGPNGHGKTSILRVISRILPVTRGKIEFAGEDITRSDTPDAVRRGIIHVSEGCNLFGNLTVLENLKLGAYNSEAWKKRTESLEMVYRLFPKLEELEKRRANRLSGGERRMVAIGRGLMGNAKLVMFDEPSMGLAPKVITEIYTKIYEISRTGISILLTEQNITYISDIVKRLYLIENGRVVLKGDTKDVLNSEHVTKTYLGRD